MNRRAILVGLAAICALAAAAISAPAASAAGATGYTCVPNQGGHNTNADCQPGSGGLSGHVPIAVNTSTTLTFVTPGEQKLTARLFGSTVELIGTAVECVGCTVENKEPSPGNMEMSGLGRLKYTGVKVNGAEKACTVYEDISPTEMGPPGVITTTPLKIKAASPTAGTIEPETPSVFAHFYITTSPTHTEECHLTGTFNISGKMPVTLDGAVVKVNITKASGNLEVDGEPASFRGETTAEAGSGAGHFPISLTAS